MPVSQRKEENTTHGGDSDSRSMMEWSSPRPEELMIKVLQEEEGASVTTTDVPGLEMMSSDMPRAQEAPTSAQLWT